MKKDTDTDLTDLETEDILRPRCSFTVSPGFKDRVMEAARSLPPASLPSRKKQRPKMYWASTAAAAAILCAAILTLTFVSEHDRPEINPGVIAETTPLSSSATSHPVRKDKDPEKIADVKPEKNKAIPRKTHSRKRKTKRLIAEPPSIPMEETPAGVLPVMEGEMPVASAEKESRPEPYEVRRRLLEARRKAEIAYIDRMRDEIAANDALITQLMNSENVYN